MRLVFENGNLTMPLPQRFEIVEPDAKVVKRHIAAHDS